jgi:tetratricopeptide (TPR) repeat protein
MCAVPGSENKSSPPPWTSRRQDHQGLTGIASRDARSERNENNRPAMTPPRRVPETSAGVPTGGGDGTAAASSCSTSVDWQPSGFFEARAMGKQLQDQGHFSEALKFYRLALYHASQQREDSSTGGVCPSVALRRAVADTLFDMGCILAARQDLVKSSEAYYACLDIRRHIISPTDPSIAAVLYELALISASSDPESAMELLLEAHAILNANASQCAERLVQVWYAIGTVQHAMGQREAAASAFHEARSLDRIQ